MQKTKIQWTESTINPTMGCSIVSPGCEHCYAMRQAYRLEKMGQGGYKGLTKKLKSGKIVWTGKISLDISKLLKAVKTKKPTMFFINSMSDLFHKDIPFNFIDDVYEIIGYAKEHTFQILTKRPDRALEYYNWTNIFKAWGEWKHIWLGTSVENQATADERIPFLLRTPAAVRWLSIEPLLGPIYKARYFELKTLDWVVVGCESGPKRRECKVEWVKSIVEQCKQDQIPVFVKQIQSNGQVLKDIEQFPKHLQIREYPNG